MEGRECQPVIARLFSRLTIRAISDLCYAARLGECILYKTASGLGSHLVAARDGRQSCRTTFKRER
jgi:hypothetical protein